MPTWSSDKSLLLIAFDVFRLEDLPTFVVLKQAHIMSVFKGKEMNRINNARDPQEARRGFLNP